LKEIGALSTGIDPQNDFASLIIVDNMPSIIRFVIGLIFKF